MSNIHILRRMLLDKLLHMWLVSSVNMMSNVFSHMWSDLSSDMHPSVRVLLVISLHGLGMPSGLLICRSYFSFCIFNRPITSKFTGPILTKCSWSVDIWLWIINLTFVLQLLKGHCYVISKLHWHSTIDCQNHNADMVTW